MLYTVFSNGEGDCITLVPNGDLLEINVSLHNCASCKLRVRGIEVNTVIYAMRNRAFLKALDVADVRNQEQTQMPNLKSVARLYAAASKTGGLPTWLHRMLTFRRR